MALVVTPDGDLEIRAPLRFSQHQIEDIVRQKSDWIKTQQEQARNSRRRTAHRQLSDGARLWYLGESYPLRITEGGAARVKHTDRFLLPENALPKAGDLLKAWYKARARATITRRVEFYARTHHLTYSSIRITSAMTRWGSCSRKNALSFTWRLVMAPEDIIDYVVVHELAHIIEKNHSRAFWAQVESMQPDYKTRRAWLKNNGRLLDLNIDADEGNVVLVKG